MRILLAEDDAGTRKMLASVLATWGYEVTTAANGRQAWDLLSEPDAPTLAILDWNMPGLEGPEVCRRLRKEEKDRYTYLILLTVRDRKDYLVQGIESGADDYITKPFDPLELKARLHAARRLLHVHEQLLAAQEAIRVEATRDPLTGVPNRAAVLDTLQKELDRAGRMKTTLGLAMVDLDGFKEVNDTCGHMVGDEVLLRVVRSLQSGVRSYDTVGRYGGDEFLIVFPEFSKAAAGVLRQRLQHAVAEKKFLWKDRSMNVSVSIGMVVAEGTSRLKAAALIKAADEALYAEKRARRAPRPEEAMAASHP